MIFFRNSVNKFVATSSPLANGKYQIVFTPVPIPTATYYVLATDYAKYAVIYGCVDFFSLIRLGNEQNCDYFYLFLLIFVSKTRCSY